MARSASSSGFMAWMLPAGFLGVAGWLAFSPSHDPIPVGEPALVEASAIAPGPRRSPMTEPAHLEIDGHEQRCNGCHQIFTSMKLEGRGISYHKDITLSHGLNNDCLNCHHATDRGSLRRLDGNAVSFNDAPQTCSGCHGTVYRDWQRGTHGKTMGSWVTGSEAQVRLTCNQCHDPHSPAYPKFTPLPGPSTLRMGEPGETGAVLDDKHRPLRSRLRGTPTRDGGARTTTNANDEGKEVPR